MSLFKNKSNDLSAGKILILGAYGFSEAIMTVGGEIGSRKISKHNSAMQLLIAMARFLLWQSVYTISRLDEVIGEPMKGQQEHQ